MNSYRLSKTIIALVTVLTTSAVSAACGIDTSGVEHFYGRASLADVRQAAEGGDAIAQDEMGRRTGLGRRGAEKSSTESLSWYQKSAAQGYCWGEANLAFMYYNGEGVDKSLDSARVWNERAAAQGNPQAQYTLGYNYVTGTGVAKDPVLAEKWFVASANQGYTIAQRALIRLYEDPANPFEVQSKALPWVHRTRDAALRGRAWQAPGSDMGVALEPGSVNPLVGTWVAKLAEGPLIITFSQDRLVFKGLDAAGATAMPEVSYDVEYRRVGSGGQVIRTVTTAEGGRVSEPTFVTFRSDNTAIIDMPGSGAILITRRE